MPFSIGVFPGEHTSWIWRVFARRALFQFVLLLTVTVPVTAQIPGIQSLLPGAQQEQSADPFGRTTPRGTITGFIIAVHRNDFNTAAAYMQVTAAQRPNTEALARDLSELMDRYLTQPVTSISESPSGTPNDGLPLDRERIGPLIIGGKSADILLVRVPGAQSGSIWLLSSGTLAQVPTLRQSLEESWIERVMPETMTRHSAFGVSIGQWLVLGASLILPLVLLSIFSRLLLAFIVRTVAGTQRVKSSREWSAALQRPVVVAGALVIHLTALLFLGLPLNFRLAYGRVAQVAAVIALAWLIRRFTSCLFSHVRNVMDGSGQTGMRSLLLLGERLSNVIVVMVAIFIILASLGVDTGTALAGLGIGGIAVALGAQKSVENLLGGIFLLTDKALAVGDICNISNRMGTIEDITLRSVRLRTEQQTLLSIPAGALAQSNIENFATREKILVQTTIRLKYGTTAQQLRAVLDGIQKLLVENPQIERRTSRIRLVEFGVRAIELELYAFVMTSDMTTFLEEREELLLKVAEVVENSGSGFAQPPEFV